MIYDISNILLLASSPTYTSYWQKFSRANLVDNDDNDNDNLSG